MIEMVLSIEEIEQEIVEEFQSLMIGWTSTSTLSDLEKNCR